LKPAEKKYSAIELEALAIWWSVTQKFRSYIEGQQFFLETDHKPLISLMKKPYHYARIERWMTTLQQYGMIIHHIPGTANTIADVLSRYPVDQPDSNDEDTPCVVTSSTQTEDIFVNAITTRSMTRKHPPPAPLTTTSSLSPPSRTPTSSVTPPSSSINDIKLLFNHDTLNQHQNQDSAIQKLKTSSPLSS
jgi:hypothetical protein